MLNVNWLEHIIVMLFQKYLKHIIVHFQKFLLRKNFYYVKFICPIKNKDIVRDHNV